LESLAMEDVSIFYGHLVHFAICVIFYGHLVLFVEALVYFSRFGILYEDKSGNPGRNRA
jgi:nitrate reductase gamma subunit